MSIMGRRQKVSMLMSKLGNFVTFLAHYACAFGLVVRYHVGEEHVRLQLSLTFGEHFK